VNPYERFQKFKCALDPERETDPKCRKYLGNDPIDPKANEIRLRFMKYLDKKFEKLKSQGAEHRMMWDLHEIGLAAGYTGKDAHKRFLGNSNGLWSGNSSPLSLNAASKLIRFGIDPLEICIDQTKEDEYLKRKGAEEFNKRFTRKWLAENGDKVREWQYNNPLLKLQIGRYRLTGSNGQTLEDVYAEVKSIIVSADKTIQANSLMMFPERELGRSGDYTSMTSKYYKALRSINEAIVNRLETNPNLRYKRVFCLSPFEPWWIRTAKIDQIERFLLSSSHGIIEHVDECIQRFPDRVTFTVRKQSPFRNHMLIDDEYLLTEDYTYDIAKETITPIDVWIDRINSSVIEDYRQDVRADIVKEYNTDAHELPVNKYLFRPIKTKALLKKLEDAEMAFVKLAGAAEDVFNEDDPYSEIVAKTLQQAKTAIQNARNRLEQRVEHRYF